MSGTGVTEEHPPTCTFAISFLEQEVSASKAALHLRALIQAGGRLSEL